LILPLLRFPYHHQNHPNPKNKNKMVTKCKEQQELGQATPTIHYLETPCKKMTQFTNFKSNKGLQTLTLIN
jgi:hypothetical protein